MTIISDIVDAMHEADREPTGLLLGISARHAFDADAHWTRVDGQEGKMRDLALVFRLSRAPTDAFKGWAFIFGDGPNPHRLDVGRRAA